MKTYKEYMEKFFGSEARIEEYVKNQDEIDVRLAHLIINGSKSIEELSEIGYGIVQSNIPVDVYGGQGTYDTIKRKSRYDPFIYCGQRLRSLTTNLNLSIGRKVYVCSPYRGDTAREKIMNIELAEGACSTIVQHGDLPIAPHLYFPRFLDDDNRMEREVAIDAGLQLMNNCDLVYAYIVDGKISEGMKRELEYAADNLGIPVVKINIQREKR